MEKINDFIEKNSALALELESELTRIPALAPESGGDGEWDKCLFLEGWLKEHGLGILERYDAPDPRTGSGKRPNLVAAIPGISDERRLWIISHLDVVPPGETALWESDPWTLVQKDGGLKLIGRGVEDNQQGLVSSVMASLALLNLGIKPAFTVKLLFAADEETGSAFGIKWLLENHPGLFRAGDWALIPDGGDSKGESIQISEKNLLWLCFKVKGVQSHGSRPDLGINARLAGADLALRLYEELHKKFPARDDLFEPAYSTFEPTKQEANVPNINTIPAEDTFYMDMRFLPVYPISEVLEEVDRVKAAVEAARRVNVSYTVVQSMESRPTSKDAPLVKALSAIVEGVYRNKTKVIGMGGGTVGAHLRNAGIDSVVWSRLEERAHSPNEYALMSNILNDARVMAALMISG